MSISKIRNKEIFCSVVMPVHNGEKYLMEAIESVLNQTYTNFEFLIIENCSTDSSVEIIKSYNDPRIRLIFEEDCGSAQAYNRGFREAKGEFVFIHDHDDVSHPERFEKQLNCMIENDIDICGSYFNIIDEGGNKLVEVQPPLSNDEITKSFYYNVTHLYNPTLCLKKEIFNIFGYFDQKYSPSFDLEFILRIIYDVRVSNAAIPLLNWRRDKTSLSHKDIIFGIKNSFNISFVTSI